MCDCERGKYCSIVSAAAGRREEESKLLRVGIVENGKMVGKRNTIKSRIEA